MAEYILRLRDPRSLRLMGEIPRYKGASWKRRAVDGGEFSVTVHKDDIDANFIRRNVIFEVRRDGAYEFAGGIERRKYNAETQVWTLGGPDLKGFWLPMRMIDPGANEFDSQTDVAAETAMKHYVTDHLIDPTDSDRAVSNSIDVPFTVEADSLRGGTVNYNARWKGLLKVLKELARFGGLTHDVILRGDDSYEYQVALPVDATATTGKTPVVFSVQGLDNVADSEYSEDTLRLVNALTVLGEGTGASRTSRAVSDTESIEDDFRREGVIDARDADSDDKLDQAGLTTIAESLLNTRTAKMEPLSVGPTTYRDVWDVGYDVTVDFKDIGEKLDRRIEEVTVTLESEEQIRVRLGARPAELARLVADRLGRTEAAQVE